MRGKGTLAVVCAGTSDLPVAEEARITAEVMGNEVDSIHDIGVAGIHRLMGNRERLTKAPRDRRLRRHGRRAAERRGRAGLLPRDRGPHQRRLRRQLQGLAALLGMLNSCASNVTVVNIDNGFGAGYVASLINRL